VIPRGDGGRAIVVDDRDRAAYLDRFHEVADDRRWIVHVSSLLDTHHHAIVETPEPDLGLGMRLVLGGHAAWFNARHGRSGSVFGERFWSARADSPGHFLRACVYAPQPGRGGDGLSPPGVVELSVDSREGLHAASRFNARRHAE